MSDEFVPNWIEQQRVKGPSMKNGPVFYRNLEEALDTRRLNNNLTTLLPKENTIDFSSNDVLSLSTSGTLTKAFLDELANHPDFTLGSTGSRILDGNNSYITTVEDEIAAFHGAETALVVGSGYDGNIAIFGAIPRPGDAIVYDDLIHASVHDGMKHSLSQIQRPFRHNNPESLRTTLLQLADSEPLIRSGARCVLIAVESVYSMDGDVCPLREMVKVANEVFPSGNAQFIIDEAHSSGMLGEGGRGLVCALGLEKQIAVRLHTYGKAHAATGAAILGSNTISTMLLNFARSVIYTTAPSFPMLASIRAGYNLLKNETNKELRNKVLHLVKYFFKMMVSNPDWNAAVDAGICSLPVSEDWESREFITQFVPVWTRQRYNYFLFSHLREANITTYPIDPPVVPRGTGRIRIVIHAHNTEAEVDILSWAICEWAKEMVDIKEGRGHPSGIPSAMRKGFDMMTASGVQVAATFLQHHARQTVR